MICKHEFIRLRDKDKSDPINEGRYIYGATAGCTKCGAVVAVFEDGEVREIKDGSLKTEE